MSQRRTLILVAAIAIGALASFLVWQYVGGIQSDANEGAESVSVFLVKQQIPRGTSGNEAQAYIEQESMPRKFKPANAIESLEDIAGQVARTDLVPNQVVVADMFVEATDPEARVSFSDNLEKIQDEDQVTWTVSIDETRGVAGLIVPGDYVNVMVTRFEEVMEGSAEGGEGQTTVAAAQARYLYQKVQVLAVGSSTVANSGPATDAEGNPVQAAPVQSGLITLIVPAKAAQVLASIPSENIYFSLVSPDYKPVPQGQIDLEPLPAEDSSLITPYGPDGARKSQD